MRLRELFYAVILAGAGCAADVPDALPGKKPVPEGIEAVIEKAAEGTGVCLKDVGNNVKYAKLAKKIREKLFDNIFCAKSMEETGEYLSENPEAAKVFVECPSLRADTFRHLHWHVGERYIAGDIDRQGKADVKAATRKIMNFIENPVVKKAAQKQGYDLRMIEIVVKPYLK
ncbi:hypothetical protein KY312_02290 [Candidatus Woesearchaeota archaeon]|nr:hypothetical protein [Candidatus Woesearchaeota archaeon]